MIQRKQQNAPRSIWTATRIAFEPVNNEGECGQWILLGKKTSADHTDHVLKLFLSYINCQSMQPLKINSQLPPPPDNDKKYEGSNVHSSLTKSKHLSSMHLLTTREGRKHITVHRPIIYPFVSLLFSRDLPQKNNSSRKSFFPS